MGDKDRYRDRSPISHGGASGGKGSGKYELLVENLPPGFRWQELKDLFRKEIGEAVYAEVYEDKNGLNGVIEFDDGSLRDKALSKLHRYQVKGRRLIVKEVGKGGGRPMGRGNMGGGSGRDRHIDSRDDRNWEGGRDRIPHEPVVWGETYGLSVKFLEGLGIAPPLVSKVFVANLDYKVNEKKLREVFKLAGKVRDVDLSVDSDGKSRGFAVIEFDHPVESVQAISMLHNQQLYDRRMTVRMDRVDPVDGHVRLPDGLGGVGMGLGTDGAPLRDVAKNLPKLSTTTNNTQINTLPNASTLNNFTAAALGAGVPPLGGFSSSAAAAAVLQQAAALNTGGTSLLGAGGNLDLLAARSDLTARELALSNLAGLSRGLGTQTSLAGSAPATLPVPGSLIGERSRNDSIYPDRNSVSVVGGGSVSVGGSASGVGSGSNDNFNNRSTKLTDTVLVDNLPHNYTWQSLKDKFRDTGDVKFAEMRGNVGMIRFGSEWEAMRAVSVMNGARIEGRQIDVRLF